LGAVADRFAIGKHEVTISQYTTFLNSVAVSDPYGLYNASMGTDLNVAGVLRSGGPGSYSYSITGPNGTTPVGANTSGNRPIAYVSWFDAARFANWMNNGATNGADTETGAYTLNGVTTGDAPARNPGATWWIPTDDEWYKAAYYKGGGTNAGYWLYPTQSSDGSMPPGNTIGGAVDQANYRKANLYSVTQSATLSSSQNYLTDVGAFSNSGSAYGTFDQGGNLEEWNDLNGTAGSRGLHGGDWNDNASLGMSSSSTIGVYSPDRERATIGFRIATVPEPTTYAMLLMAGACAVWSRLRKRSGSLHK
jgi:formylglycine-generating enzyme required for sulfatase activity